MQEALHSVKLIEEKCKGCMKCMLKCPVEAVRIKNSRALIYADRCIDCGECIRVCPYNAHVAIRDDISSIKKYKIRAAIPSVTLYSQFGGEINPGTINEAVLSLGFNEVFDITYACDIVAEIIKKELSNTLKPSISSFCPAVVRLIQTRYSDLIEHVIKVMTPIEVAAILIRDKYSKLGYDNNDVGIFYLTPCVSRITRSRNTNENREINGVIAISDIYPSILKYISKSSQDSSTDSSMSFTGLSWAVKGGQIKSIGVKEFLSVDGVENVIKILDDIERGKYKDVEFIEAFACVEGCLGGLLLVENPFNAKRMILKCFNKLKNTYVCGDIADGYKEQFTADYNNSMVKSTKFSEDFSEAVRIMKYMNHLINILPGIDCGQCGAPSCRAFAEDVARGLSSIEECKMLKERVEYED